MTRYYNTVLFTEQRPAERLLKSRQPPDGHVLISWYVMVHWANNERDMSKRGVRQTIAVFDGFVRLARVPTDISSFGCLRLQLRILSSSLATFDNGRAHLLSEGRQHV